MQDAVAEVLLERRAIVPRRSPFLILSLILHFAVVLTALVVTRRAQNQPRTSVLNIRLAPSQAPPVTIAPPAPVPAKPVAAKPVEKKIEKPLEPKIIKKKPVEKTVFGKSHEKPVPPPDSTSATAQMAATSQPSVAAAR